MNELLEDVITAHGWARSMESLWQVQAAIVTGGARWGMKALSTIPTHVR